MLPWLGFISNMLCAQSAFRGCENCPFLLLKHIIIVLLLPCPVITGGTCPKGLKLRVSPGYRYLWDPVNMQSHTHKWEPRHSSGDHSCSKAPSSGQQSPKTVLSTGSSWHSLKKPSCCVASSAPCAWSLGAKYK